MAEARIDEEEEELRELREPGVRRNLRQSSPAAGRSERNKPDRRLSSQGPLSSIRSAIKRTSTRTHSQGDHSRERRRPEITILSAEPLATNAWFPGASAGFPPPPPPTEHIWGGSIPAAAQPPPSYDQVIREKTQEQAPPPASAPRRVTTTIATQTDFVPEAEDKASEPQCSVASQAVETKAPGGGRRSKPPRPSFPFMPKALPSDPPADSSNPPGGSQLFPSVEQTVTKVHRAEAINSLIDTSCEFLPCSLTSGSGLQAQPCEPCLVALDPPTSTATSSALTPSPEPTADGQPKEEARRPTPRPRSKSKGVAKDVKVQTLVRLKDCGESVQQNQSGGEVPSSKYLQELLDVFGSGDQFLSNQSDQSGESDQDEPNGLVDQSEEDMSLLRTKIQAFERKGSVDDVDGEPVKRPEPRPRAQLAKLAPPVAARPAVPSKPSLPPPPSDKASTPGPGPETNNHKDPGSAPTPAPRPLLPKKSPVENENKEAPANFTRPPRPVVAARPKNHLARDESCAGSRPAPPVQPKVAVDLLELSSAPTVTEPTETGPDCDNSTANSNDVATKQEQPQPIPERPSVPQKPTVIRVSGKTSKSSGDGSAEPIPPLPTQNAVGGLAPPVVQKSSPPSKSSAQPPAQESTNSDKPGGSLPLPPRPPGVKVPPIRPPPAKMPPGRPPPPQTAGHKRTQSKGALKKGPPLPPRPCPGHPLYNAKKNGTQVPSERKDSSNPECHAGDIPSRVQDSSTKTSAPLIDLSSTPEPQTSVPKQARRESIGLQAQVLHDFTPEGPTELALKVGDMVSMVERVDSDWYRGTCRGSSGIFPVNHVKTLSPSPANGKKEAMVATPMSGPRCVARFDYAAAQSDELSFSQGAVIRLKEHVDQDWVRGELEGRTGVFPRNFVEVVEDLPASEAPQSVQKKTEVTEPTGMATSLQNQEAAKSCQSKPAEEEWALALFDFTAQTDEDLSFKQGARILITEHVDSDWCNGRLEGKEGLFPKAFVEINPTAQAADTPHREPEGGGRAQALFSFSSECEEELSVQVGDIVTSLESIDEEWFFGEVRGTRGLIPKNYVLLLQAP
ncbi:SH3 domain-containing protein 19-like isoform X1 [Conger conger]|uniref:SH3 domain-containing protein 19-like isoform X1 n=1 Tax=Conger conger TaxID=82655 RepID=UPI002A5A9768|nr:SH3 domain-containing protein 19-like isoform X1 [Conger conger]